MDVQLIAIFAAVAVFILCFFIYGIFSGRRKDADFLIKLKLDYGKMPDREYDPAQYANIAKYYLKNKKENSIDDITWNDVDMDSVFLQMNNTLSSAGEEYLYYRLRTPNLDGIEEQKDEELIQYFMKHPEDRVKMQLAFHKMGRTGKYSLHDYLGFLDLLGRRDNVKHIMTNLCYLVGIGLIFLSPFTGIMLLIILICYSMITYSTEKRDIEPYITSLIYVLRVVNGIGAIEKLKIDAISENTEKLKEKRKVFAKFVRSSQWLVKGNSDADPLSIVYIYLKTMFHIDIIVFNSMLADVRKHIDDINDIVTEAGYLESVIAIGSYRTMKETYCIPQFTDEMVMKAENLYHPLISEPVKNSFEIKRGMLITGSNASGKSTFLKTVALNAILAETIHTCLADSFLTRRFRIYSSMALQDSLSAGESYYIVEIKSIKRILDAAASECSNPILCFVDEVLRGTNTVERIAASSQILQYMTNGNVMSFAATHDIELTQILENSYDNYHFDEDFIDNDIVFNYQLKSGKATSRNAIRLLKVMGYPGEVIQDADKMAAKFTETGKW